MLLPIALFGSIALRPAVIGAVAVLAAIAYAARIALAVHAGMLPTTKKQSAGPVALFVIATTLIGAVHSIPLRAFVVEPYHVPTDAMRPMVPPDDLVFIIKMGRHSKVDRGSVVVFDHGDGKDFIKRVIAVGGDTVDIVNGQVSLNQHPIERRPCDAGDSSCFIESIGDVAWKMQPGKGGYGDGHWVVPPEQYFMVGDNRDESLDSRVEGPVKAEAVKGRVAGTWVAFQSGPPWVKVDRIGARPYLTTDAK
ncbi:MAG: signal peptidase I [Myxococcaceae bacterium]